MALYGDLGARSQTVIANLYLFHGLSILLPVSARTLHSKIEKHDILSEVTHLTVSCVKSLHLKFVRGVVNDCNTTLHLPISTSNSTAIASDTEFY